MTGSGIYNLSQVKEFQDWLQKYAKDEGIEDGEGYTMAHFEEIRDKAKEFGFNIDSDGYLSVIRNEQ